MTPESEKVWNEMLARMSPRDRAFWTERESLSKHAYARTKASIDSFQRRNKFWIMRHSLICFLNYWNKALGVLMQKAGIRPFGVKRFDKRLLHKNGRL